jgi:MazG family protein
MTTKRPIEKLIEVMRQLREPEKGCPWDLEQDFKSIAPYTIEEAYEVADAIDRSDMDDLREELGDLLLQPIYHAQMASEAELFTIEDVIKDITAKMISRHPHVFGDAAASSPEDVNKIWDERKKSEKKNNETRSILDEVTRGLPALLRAQKLQKKAASVGFCWPDVSFALAKLEEELGELKNAMVSGDKDHIAEELGDALFVLVNIGRMQGINAEESLRKCNAKFYNRFKGIEDEFKKKDLNFTDASLTQMEEEWVRQKSIIKN